MKAEINPIEMSTHICAFKAGGYFVALQPCEADPDDCGNHIGLNIIAQNREVVPLPMSMNGVDVFVLQEVSDHLGPDEYGRTILAQNLTVALDYIADRNNKEVAQ